MSALTVPPPVVPWRGHVLASGLWFSGPDVDQARVLGEWSDECAVRELEGGILLSWSRPRRMDVATAPGLVLVDQGGALLGGPAPAQAGEVVLPRHGALVRARLVDLPRVDPADWLDVHGLPVHAVRPLGPPPASRALPLALAITPADARTLLGRPAATPEQQAFLEELRAAGNASASVRSGVGRGGSAREAPRRGRHRRSSSPSAASSRCSERSSGEGRPP